MARLKVAVLISGRGSNLQALLDAAVRSDFPAEIALVISNVADAFGLQRASVAGVPTAVIDHKSFSDRAAFDRALDQKLRAEKIELVCLAGFMRLLTADFTSAWQGRLINIHPSLLPSFKGMHTHAQALAAGVKLHGCTVHQVTASLDDGPIIAQAAIPVLPGDDPDSLAARVLAAEHLLYPAALALLAGGQSPPGQAEARLINPPPAAQFDPRMIGRQLAALLFLLLPVALHAEDTLLWLLYDAPPLTIRSGDQTGQGFGDLQQRFLADHLPNFHHRSVPAALDRIWHDMGEKDGVCTINVIKTAERMRLYSFTHRPLPTPGFRVMIANDRRDDFAPMIDADGNIDLDKLAANAKLRGGSVAARRYPEVLDRFLNQPQRGAKLESYPEPNQLFSLLQAGRIDFAIILAVETPYYLRRFPAMPYPALLPIRGVPLANNGYIACSRGFIGQRAIQQINRLLDDDRAWAAYIGLLQGWFSPTESAVARATRPDPD